MKKLFSALLVLAVLISNVALAGMSFNELLVKGGNYAVNGEFEKAEAAFEIAIKMEPENIRVYDAIKHMCLLKGDLEGALRALDTALEYAPGEGELYFEKANILYQMDEVQEAEKMLLYAEVLGEEPDDEIWISAYNAYYEQGEYERVIEAFESMSDAALTVIDMEKYTRALIRTGQYNLAQALSLIQARSKDVVLQDAIESGKKLSLVPADMENVLDYPIFVSLDICNQLNLENSGSENALLYEIAEDGKRVKLTEEGKKTLFDGEIDMEDVFVINTSPSGYIRLYSINGIACIVKNGKIMPIGLNEKRSVPLDEGGVKYASRALSRLHGCKAEQNGIIWSKDERCFVLSFPNGAVNMAYVYDLMFVDTETGDFIVANSTPKKIMQEGFEYAHLAVFDDAGENIYYYAFVNEGEDCEYSSALKKYNIDTGSTETLFRLEEREIYYPKLHLTENQEIKGIYSPRIVDENGGLISFRETSDGWIYEKEAFDEISGYQSPSGYSASENSGMEVVFCRIRGIMGYLTVANENLDAPGHNCMILLPVNGNQAYAGEIPSEESINSKEFKYAWGGYLLPGVTESTLAVPAPEFMNVLEMTMSPDGYYALLVVQYPESKDNESGYTIETGLCVLDLQTFKYTMIEVPEDEALESVKSFDMLWNEKNEIILPTASWTLYTLSIE